jgi:hypothetical protein
LKDEKSSDVVEYSDLEVNACDALSLCTKLISSSEVLLRQTAVSAALALTRAVISHTIEEIIATAATTNAQDSAAVQRGLTDFYLKAFEDFVSRKSSRVPVKLFDELISRYPDYGCFSLIRKIVSGCASAKTLFLRTECCRLLAAILQRYKSLSKQTAAFVISSCGAALASVGTALSAEAATTGVESKPAAVEFKAKRVRPILQLAKDYLQLFVTDLSREPQATEKKPRSGSITSDSNAIDEIVVKKIISLTGGGSAFRESQSTVIKRLAEQISELVGKIPDRLITKAVIGASATETKKTKKRKGVSEDTPAAVEGAALGEEKQNKKRKQRAV